MPPTGAGEHDLAIDKIVDLGMYLCMDIQPMVGGVVKCLYMLTIIGILSDIGLKSSNTV